jgi:hypothetical protein
MIKRGDHNPFHCGDRVYDVIDPRHVGTIRAVAPATARVAWDNNLESIVRLRDLRKE